MYSVIGHTVAELIAERADSNKKIWDLLHLVLDYAGDSAEKHVLILGKFNEREVLDNFRNS